MKAAALIVDLLARVAELERGLGLDSTNSSMPPSSDGPAKPAPKSLREKSGKKPGGQKGRKGRTLRQFEDADEVTVLDPLDKCHHCGTDLTGEPVKETTRHQQIDIEATPRRVREVQVPVRRCPKCRARVRPRPPPGFERPVQYGPNTMAMAVALAVHHSVPLARIAEILAELLGQAPSEGSVQNWICASYTRLESAEEEIRRKIRQAPVIHVDETGLRVNGRTHWVHVVATKWLTLLSASPKRGREGLDELDVLDDFRGTMVHDAFSPYFRYDEASHALCHAHHLRELKGFIDEGQAWAVDFRRQLIRIFKWRQNRLEQDRPFKEAEINRLVGAMRNVIGRSLDSLTGRRRTISRNGNRIRQTHAKNFLDRMERYFDEVTAFIRDPAVPFTNNQAERDIRMVKVKQKIAGCLRTTAGADHYARIRGCLLTARKNGVGAMEALRRVHLGLPLVDAWAGG